MKKLILSVSVLGFLIMPFAAMAEEPTLEEKIPAEVKRQNLTDSKILTFSYENDMIGGGKDEYYTNGVRASLLDLNAELNHGYVPSQIEQHAIRIPKGSMNIVAEAFPKRGL